MRPWVVPAAHGSSADGLCNLAAEAQPSGGQSDVPWATAASDAPAHMCTSGTGGAHEPGVQVPEGDAAVAEQRHILHLIQMQSRGAGAAAPSGTSRGAQGRGVKRKAARDELKGGKQASVVSLFRRTKH